MVLRFGQLFDQKLQKVAHFVKEREKSSIWLELLFFGTNCHGFAFWATFRPKGAESGSFREKPRKIIDFAKSSNFWHKQSWSCVFGNFLAESCKKVAHFVKKHEKSSIWPKLATFGKNYHCLAFSATFSPKVAKSGSFHERP